MRAARPLILTILAAATAVDTGCSGLKFINSPCNLPVPPTLRERTLWTDTAIIQYRLDALSGYVLERSAQTSQWKRKRQILPTNFAPTPEPIVEGEFYHSIVDSQIAGSGSVTLPIVSIAGSLKANERMELSITDSALIFVPDKAIPYSDLAEYAQANPIPPGAQRVWVQGVMLTKLIFAKASETNSSATVSGAAYQVDGKVFNSNTAVQRQPYVTMLLVDLNEVEKRVGAAGGIEGFVRKVAGMKSLSGSSLRYTALETTAISE